MTAFNQAAEGLRTTRPDSGVVSPLAFEVAACPLPLLRNLSSSTSINVWIAARTASSARTARARRCGITASSFLGCMHGPANSPPEAGRNRHLRPVNSPPLAEGTEPLGEAEAPLTNNFIW